MSVNIERARAIAEESADGDTIRSLCDELERATKDQRRAMLNAAANGFDAAVGCTTYEDGSPVDVVAVQNPYRANLEAMK